MGRLRCLQAGGELGDRHAKALGFLDMIQRGVIMAGDRDAARSANVRQLIAVPVGIFLRLGDTPRDELIELHIAQAALLLIEQGVLIHGLELALARSMVHERNQTDTGVAFELGEMFHDIWR